MASARGDEFGTRPDDAGDRIEIFHRAKRGSVESDAAGDCDASVGKSRSRMIAPRIVELSFGSREAVGGRIEDFDIRQQRSVRGVATRNQHAAVGKHGRRAAGPRRSGTRHGKPEVIRRIVDFGVDALEGSAGDQHAAVAQQRAGMAGTRVIQGRCVTRHAFGR